MSEGFRGESSHCGMTPKVQYRSAVACEMPRTSAASDIVKPAKKRNFTNSARAGDSSANLVRASSSARRSPEGA
jgi:hypothetical protein